MGLNKKKLDELYDQLDKDAKTVSKAGTLPQVQETLTKYYDTMDSIQNMIVSANLDDNAMYEALKRFGNVQSKHTADYPIPVFDGSLDEVSLYDDYEGYFQRYGCINPDWILSWDVTSVLFMDFDSNTISVIDRPDVLLANA